MSTSCRRGAGSYGHVGERMRGAGGNVCVSTCVPGLNSYIWCMLRGESEVISWHCGAEEGLGRKVKASSPR